MINMTASELNRYLEDWDHASKVKRIKILSSFIDENNGKTAPQLEELFANCASLFFTRLTAWLRLSYLNATSINPQLKAILLFLDSSNGQNFLTEFIEVGGIMSLLEVLGLGHLPESDKALALKLIFIISSKGRKYKELVCECFGVRAVAECLAKSSSIECKEECHIVLHELSTGNPKFLNQVYKAMITLLKSASADAQQVAAQLLQYIQPMHDPPGIGIIQPALLLLRSLHVAVQYEGCQLIKLLMNYENVQKEILVGLVNSLHPSKRDIQDQPEILSDPDGPDILPPYPVYIQQASAAKLIGLLSKDSDSFAKRCINLGCVRYLLLAMGNENHPDSQKQAGLTLHHLIQSFEEVEMKVKEALGQAFYHDYTNDPGSFYLNITPIHMDILAANQVDVKFE